MPASLPLVIANRRFNLEGWIGWYYVGDYGAKCNNSEDDVDSIQLAIASARQGGGGIIAFPSGGVTSVVSRAIQLPSNCYLHVPIGTTVKLADGAVDDVVVNQDYALNLGVNGNSRLGIVGGGRIDGNRANNTSGNRGGVYFYNCQHVTLENIEVMGARYDGIGLERCEYVHVRGCYVHDCGQHGIALSNSLRVEITGTRIVDCCRVVTSGNADGINLDLLSTDNAIEGCIVEDTFSNSPRMGYGVREAASSLDERNWFMGGVMTNLQTGRVRLESGDSESFVYGAMNLPSGGLVINP